MSHGTHACTGPRAPRGSCPEEGPPGLPGCYGEPHSTVSPHWENRNMSDPEAARDEQAPLISQETETALPTTGGITSPACPQGPGLLLLSASLTLQKPILLPALT